MKDIRCPECGSDYIIHNRVLFTNGIIDKDQYMYTCGDCNNQFNPRSKIEDALEIASRFGQVEGGHHQTWVIDQIVRALTGCQIEQRSAIDCNGNSYVYGYQAESQDYLDWIKNHDDWEIGIPP